MKPPYSAYIGQGSSVPTFRVGGPGEYPPAAADDPADTAAVPPPRKWWRRVASRLSGRGKGAA